MIEGFDKEYDWDTEIGEEANVNPFVILPDGEYPFTVTALERGYYEGNPEKGKKPCLKAMLMIEVDGGEHGTAYVKENIFVKPENAWKIKQFFVSIGLVREDAERFIPQWNSIVGCVGRCRTRKHQFKAKNGDMVDTNDIKKFLPPSTGTLAAPVMTQPAQAAPTQPAFSFPAPPVAGA